MRGPGGDADSQRADLSVRGLSELDGAADAQSGRIPVTPQRESIVPVRGQGNDVGHELRAGVVANHYRNI